MRVAILALMVCWVVPPAQAQHSALIISSSRNGRTVVMPVGAATNTAGAEPFHHQKGRTGGCGITPSGDLSSGREPGPLLSRDGRRIVYAADGKLVVRTVGEADQIVIPRSPYDEPACLISIAADSSSVLYFRVAHYTPPSVSDDEEGVGSPAIEGQFEVYSFVTRRTVSWRPPVRSVGLDDFILVDDHTLVTIETDPDEDLRRRLVVVDLTTNQPTEIAATEGHANTFGQLTYGSGWLLWLDGQGHTQFHALRRPTGNAVWSSLPGAWAEFQRNQLSPSGTRLARIHRVSHGTGNTLEMLEAGSAQSRVLAQNVYAYVWESDDSILLAERRETRSRRSTLHLVRLSVDTGVTTELSMHPFDGRTRVVFAR